MKGAKLGFEMRKIRVRLDDILPVRQIKGPQITAGRYHTILASIKEVGLIEPLMIHPQKGMPEKWLLLDGHMRYHALRELGETEADCLISEEFARMEQEMGTLERDLKAAERAYGENVLNLTVSLAYVKRLLGNPKIVRFLSGNHPEILSALESMATAETL